MTSLNKTKIANLVCITALAAAALSLCAVARADDGTAAVPAATPHTQLAPQPWQERRAQFAKIVGGVRAKDAVALKQFDDVLTEFDTKPLARTPLENMEILGVYYLPREGVEKVLPAVVLNAVLGWYDALRFGSQSGRAEISSNLFKMAFVVAGPDASNKAAKFFDERPERTEQLVAQGIAMATAHKDDPHYDHHWPTAFGLERIICAQQGPCEEIKALPENQWDEAWSQAQQRVRAYYHGSAPAAPKT